MCSLIVHFLQNFIVLFDTDAEMLIDGVDIGGAQINTVLMTRVEDDLVEYTVAVVRSGRLIAYKRYVPRPLHTQVRLFELQHIVD